MDYDAKFLKSNSHPKIGNKQFVKQALIQPGYTSLTASLWVECLLKASQVSNTLISSYPRKKSSTAEIRDHCKMLYNIENHRIEELDNLATIFSDRFRICYVLDQPPEEWDGGVGFISKEMILTHCPAPASDIQILRCEPQLMNKAMAAHLKDLGYTPQMQF